MSKTPRYRYEDNGDNIYSSSKPKRILTKQKIKVSPKKKVINTFVIIFSITLFSLGIAMVYGNSILAGMYNNLANASINEEILSDPESSENSDISITNNIIKDPMVLNIMIFGSDVRPNKSNYGNSDSMILLSIDNRHKKMKLTSFMRDTYVNIPEYQNAKLNAAYAAGGPALSIETIERNFGVDIDRYVVLYFDTFPTIIDSLGGVDVKLNKEEAEYLNHDFPNRKPAFKSAGDYKLNGQEALDYARMRHVGNNDFERTQRQRNLISSLITKLKSNTDIATIAKLMTQFLPSVTTNITVNEMTGLAQNSIKYMNYPTEQYRVPVDGDYYNDTVNKWGQVQKIKDMNKTRLDLARFIYEETVDKFAK